MRISHVSKINSGQIYSQLTHQMPKPYNSPCKSTNTSALHSATEGEKASVYKISSKVHGSIFGKNDKATCPAISMAASTAHSASFFARILINRER